MTSRTPNAYEILMVSRTATEKEVRAAYRAKAKATHPDLNSSANAPEQFRRATDARDEVLDPARRAKLDRRLRADELLAKAKQDASPFAGSRVAQTPTDAIGDILNEFRRKGEEARKKQETEQRERLQRAIRDTLATKNSTGRTNSVHSPAQQNHTPFYSLAQSLTKSRPADERFVWSMLGLIVDGVMAS